MRIRPPILILRVANNTVDFGCVGILKLMMIIPTKWWKSGEGGQEGYRNDNHHRMMKNIEKLEFIKEVKRGMYSTKVGESR